MRWGLLFLLLLAAMGCRQGECVGLLRFGDKCVAVDPFDKTPPTITVDPPLYTREVGTVRLTSDEPATIYYTIDGTSPTTDSDQGLDEVVIPNVPDDAQLRYFAVDLAGNASPEQVRLWVIDRDGPGAPADFKLALAGDTRTLTWTPADDPRPGGVLIARVEGRLGGLPESGREYAVGDTVAGATVVAVSTDSGATSFAETVPVTPGLVRYVAWPFDDLFNYGATAGDYVVVPFAEQTMQLDVDVANETVAVTQPSVLGVSATAIYDSSASTLTLKVTVQNTTSRVLFAPKLLLTSAQTGFTFTADGTLDIGNGPVGFRQLAPAIAPLGASVASLTFTGVAANAQLSLAFAFRDNRAVAATVRDSDRSAGQIADDVTGVFLRQLGTATLCQSGSTGQSYSMAITPDGRVITGDRAGGVVSAYDLITGARVRTVTVKPDKAHIPQLVLDPSGSTVYALASAQHPRRANQNAAGTDAELVRLDAATLTITGRLSLGSSRNRSLEMSPDGKTLAIATGLSAGAILVDISSFTIKGQIMPGFRANVATFSPDGTQLAMVGEQIQTFGLDGTAKMDPIPTPLSTGRKVVRAVWPDPSFVWIARGSGGIAKVDLTDPGATPLTDDTKCRLAEVYDGKLYTESCSTPRAIVVLDLADGTQLNQIDGIASLQGHHVVRSPF